MYIQIKCMFSSTTKIVRIIISPLLIRIVFYTKSFYFQEYPLLKC